MRRALFLFAAIALMGSSVLAQLEVSGGLDLMVDDNVNNNAEQLKDRILTLNLGAAYDVAFEPAGLSFEYAGTFGMFQAISDRSYAAHTIGLTLSGSVGDDGAGMYLLEAGGGMRQNKSVYEFYDNDQVGISATYRHVLGEGVFAQAGYVYRRVSFDQATFFSYGEHVASANVTTNFQTRTTIIGFAEYGRKAYLEPGTVDTTDPSNLATIGVTQWLAGIRIGQGLAEGTGLSLMARYQWNPVKQSRYLISDLGMLSDDELFDDRYGYEGLNLTAMLTQVVWDGAFVRLSYGLQEKEYGLLPAFSLDGLQISDHREDRRTYWSILGRTGLGQTGLELTVSATFIRNASNDPYYDYRNTAISTGITIPF